jgi:phosphatidylethanolamine/phosphatidyl-N-methylethanolamine N-methyltransferase
MVAKKVNQSIYHLFAPIYDIVFGPPYAAMRRRATRLLGLKPGERLLISGVGTGLDLPQIPAGVEVTSIDISADMLFLARKKVSPAHVHLEQMDAQRLALPNAYFDATLLNLIVSVVPDGHAVFSEAWRTLKPGGRLVLFDKFAPEGRAISPLRPALGWLIRQIGTDVNRRISEVTGELANGSIEINEPGLLFGQYRILRYKKAYEKSDEYKYSATKGANPAWSAGMGTAPQ